MKTSRQAQLILSCCVLTNLFVIAGCDIYEDKADDVSQAITEKTGTSPSQNNIDCSNSPSYDFATMPCVRMFKEDGFGVVAHRGDTPIRFSSWAILDPSIRQILVTDFLLKFTQNTKYYLEQGTQTYPALSQPMLIVQDLNKGKSEDAKGRTQAMHKEGEIILDIELIKGSLVDVMANIGHEWGHAIFRAVNPKCAKYYISAPKNNDPKFKEKYKAYHDQIEETWVRTFGNNLVSAMNPEIGNFQKAK